MARYSLSGILNLLKNQQLDFCLSNHGKTITSDCYVKKNECQRF